MAAPILKKIAKGELLFNEGDPSKSMYFVQTGTIRLYKKKGNASIELGMIHKGEVIGEMGFLDGGPRSASAEALHDVELMEITNNNLVEQMKVLPPWLMVLLKTIVNRLRSANNKIRQLESASTAYTYGSEGVSTTYQYMNVYDVLKTCTALLLVGAKNGEKTPEGYFKVQMQRVVKYANSIMGIHASKITEMFDILERVGMAKVERISSDKIDISIFDLDQLEQLVNYINDENLKDHTKKNNLSIKSVLILGYMSKHMNLFPVNAEGLADVNLARIIQLEKEASGGKVPFNIDETFKELVKAGIATEVAMKDSNTASTLVKPLMVVRMYKIQKVLKELDIINEKKREQAARGNAYR